MPIYEYKAFANGGAIKSGIVDADSERDARSKLRRDNLLVSKLTETRGGRKVRGKSKGDGKSGGKAGGALGSIMAARAAAQGPGSREIDIVSGMTRQLATKAREADALEQALELSRSASKTTADQLQIEIDSVKNALGQSQAALATVTEQCTGLSTRLEDRDKLIDSQLAQQHELQLRLECSEESYRTTLTQLENMRQSVSDLNAQLSVRDAELSAEKRAHKVCTERLESTSMIVEKNEALTLQLQEALKELLAAKRNSS